MSQPQFLVGLGASAGGLDAIERFFDATPADSGLAFVVVQHLSPDFKSMMNELLARHTAMKIHLVEDEMLIEANGIYLIPPRKNMAIKDGKLRLTEQDPDKGLHLPIDIFFESLAENFGKNAVAVVLSGTGSDGSRGLQSVHESGGLVLVQDLESSSFDGMPRNAIGTGMADVICRPETMAARILEYVKKPDDFVRKQFEYSDAVEADHEKIGVFRLFRNRYGIDFSLYKPTTINRRLERRMKLARCEGLDAYVEMLEKDSDELDSLYRDLLVEVTHFFRDPEAFDRLRFEILPEIVQNANDEIRIWIPGCATGEEAYSLAIILHHLSQTVRGAIDIKVFATDVHQKSLEAAGAAVFRPETIANVPAEYMKEYFTKAGELYHLSRDIREMVVFAPHDITKDPPFTRLDFISCRNVLIYLEPEVQQRVLSMFHFGLRTGGVMFLGPSETVGNLEREFEPLDHHWRVYKKIRDVRLPEAARIPSASALSRGIIPTRPQFSPRAVSTGAIKDVPNIVDKLLSRYVPPSLLVNQYHELVHSFGDARSFLKQPEGQPTLDILRMVEGDLRTAISAAMHRAAGDNLRVIYRGVRIRVDDDEKNVTVAVEPFTQFGEKMFLVCLEESEPPTGLETLTEEFDPESGSGQRITDLERELAYTRESLQATVEELETSNEELQSTNEELIASNEELQSTNEELHSVNEELYTVNAEHQRKIDDLNQVTLDKENLLRSTNIGIVFLDGQYRVREFTPATSGLLHLIEQDIGRPIDHIAGKISTSGLMTDIRHAVSTRSIVESRIVTREATPYLQRIVPYVPNDSEIDGVIVTFTDLTKLEEATVSAQQSGLQLQEHQTLVYAISHDMQAPLRHIREHVGRLHEAVATPNDAATDSLRVLDSRAEKMKMMLDGLLQFSRVITRGAEFRAFDLNEVVQNARDSLRSLIRSKDAEIHMERLPALEIDESQMETVFRNLLENALLYSKAPPEIHITAEMVEKTCEINVRDNGIGISDNHYDRIFVVFQRLEFLSDVPGDGMGLPIARRIVERHGGSLTVSSDPEGSTFTIRLPLSQDTDE